jgi:hypothetical protein
MAISELDMTLFDGRPGQVLAGSYSLALNGLIRAVMRLKLPATMKFESTSSMP